jgi:hypothetical protein
MHPARSRTKRRPKTQEEERGRERRENLSHPQVADPSQVKCGRPVVCASMQTD